jgi:hypothetical protein
VTSTVSHPTARLSGRTWILRKLRKIEKLNQRQL